MIFHPNDINWSKRNRGNVARTQIYKNIIKIIFIANQIHPGIQLKIKIFAKGNQPPKNNTTNNADIKIILEYLLREIR